jgi:hypothetical protein
MRNEHASRSLHAKAPVGTARGVPRLTLGRRGGTEIQNAPRSRNAAEPCSASSAGSSSTSWIEVNRSSQSIPREYLEGLVRARRKETDALRHRSERQATREGKVPWVGTRPPMFLQERWEQTNPNTSVCQPGGTKKQRMGRSLCEGLSVLSGKWYVSRGRSEPPCATRVELGLLTLDWLSVGSAVRTIPDHSPGPHGGPYNSVRNPSEI